MIISTQISRYIRRTMGAWKFGGCNLNWEVNWKHFRADGAGEGPCLQTRANCLSLIYFLWDGYLGVLSGWEPSHASNRFLIQGILQCTPAAQFRCTQNWCFGYVSALLIEVHAFTHAVLHRSAPYFWIHLDKSWKLDTDISDLRQQPRVFF